MRSYRNRFRSLSLAVSLTLGAMVASPHVAFADEPSEQDIAQARDLGGQGQAAFEAGNFAEAEKLFKAATRLYSAAPTLTLGLARSQAKLGKFLSAQEAYNKIIREWGNVSSPPPAFKDALEAARAEIGAVSGRAGSATIVVEGAPKPQVTIDGDTIPPAALGLKRPVDPGHHVVRAQAEGYKPAETTINVAEGQSVEAKLTLQKEESAAPAPGDTTTAPGSDTGVTAEPGGKSNKTLAFVAFGVGGAGLVVGAITGLMAMGKHSDLEKACGGETCPATEQDNVDSYKTMGTISTVGFIVAGVGAAAGAILWLTAPKETTTANGSGRYATARTKPSIVPYLGPLGGGVTGRF